MEIKAYKNQYGYDTVNCPFCPQFAYLRKVVRTNPDALADLKRHITNQAKTEAFSVALGLGGPTPHFNYYKEHTTDKRVVTPQKRVFDNDLTLTKPE